MVKTVPLNASMSTIQSIFKNYRDIIFTKGTYKLTSTIKIYSNTKINLNGAVLRRYHSGPLLRLNDSSSTIAYNGTHDVDIYNGTLEGMNKLGLSANTLLTMFHGLNIKVHDIKFLDIPGCHAIDCVACKNVTISKCKFNGYASVGNDFREAIQIDYAYHGEEFAY